MKIYHCDDPKENPIPLWLRETKPSEAPKPQKQAEPLSQDLSAFFPDFYRPWKKKKWTFGSPLERTNHH